MDPKAVGDLLLLALLGGTLDWISASQLKHNRMNRETYRKLGIEPEHDPFISFLLGDTIWKWARALGILVLAFTFIDAIAVLSHHPLL